VKNGVIRNGSSRGSGKALANVKSGMIKNGSSFGSGSNIGMVRDIQRKVRGLESLDDDAAVGMYHFLVEDIF
jgi:hypothetical protein